MKRLKVMTVVGTRPEIIRLSAVINKLDESEAIDHVLVHTGQNYDYELNEVFFNDFNLKKPDYFLNAATGTAVETIGNILMKIDPILEEVKPDAFLVLGDTNSCLCAIAAKRRHIPIFHMEAGNRCFDQRVPEETNRKIVDHTADINLTYSDIAREYLLREGLPADRVIKTGSPMFEVLNSRKDDIEKSDVLERLGLETEKYFVVSAHREENISSEQNFMDLVDSLNTIAKKYQIPVIVSTHPRTRKMMDNLLESEVRELINSSKLILIEPASFLEMIVLEQNAKMVITDSGGVQEEAPSLGKPVLVMRDTTERPEAVQAGTVILVGTDKNKIIKETCRLLENPSLYKKMSELHNPYGDGLACKRIVEFIQSL